MNKAIIVDLDGTLCNLDHRLKYLHDEKNNKGLFFSSIAEDKLNVWCKEIIERFKHDHAIVLVTGRSSTHYFVTLDWLKSHDIKFNWLFMRSENDNRSDSVVKKQIFDMHIKEYFDILFVVDDRKKVVDMWRSIGLTVLQCADGDY